MTTKQLIISAVVLFFSSLVSLAQDPVATLQHKGVTQVFYGQNSFVEALTAAAKGDTLLLSAGGFTTPAAIDKGITIIGSGHFPDSVSVKTRTAIIGNLTINKGADSLHLEGLYINGDINYDGASSINYVKVVRCRLGNAYFHSNSTAASKNNCSYEECYIEGSIQFYTYGNDLLVKHCIINGSISSISANAVIDGNIFLNDYMCFVGVSSSAIRNNIFFKSSINIIIYSGSSNVCYNNIYVGNLDYGANGYGSDNYGNIPQADIFVNQTGNTLSYAHNYHLKNPEKYIGPDGTQVGLYGGAIPFKEKGLPSNPQIIRKSIGHQTDVNGNLPVNITVKAQAN